MPNGMGEFAYLLGALMVLVLIQANVFYVLPFDQARPLLEDCAMDELIDPRLGNSYSEQEVCCMLHAASLCIRRDPHTRPRMSQVIEFGFSLLKFCLLLASLRTIF